MLSWIGVVVFFCSLSCMVLTTLQKVSLRVLGDGLLRSLEENLIFADMVTYPTIQKWKSG
jgi:hypothetical protein